jgi:hypothetical protein
MAIAGKSSFPLSRRVNPDLTRKALQDSKFIVATSTGCCTVCCTEEFDIDVPCQRGIRQVGMSPAAQFQH